MKLFSQSAELKAIRTITASSSSKMEEPTLTPGSYLLANLDRSFFHSSVASAAYNRVSNVLKKRAKILSFSDLQEDPAIPEELRIVLRAYTKAPVSTVDKARDLLDLLDKYRKTRVLYEQAKHTISTLKESSVDVDKLIDHVSATVLEARTSVHTDTLHIMGKNSTGDELLEKALSKQDEILLKTGFTEVDRRNGGVPAEGVLLLVGGTSSGKSVLRMNLLVNMIKLNKVDVATVSFEMSPEKETRRLLSCLTSIPLWKFTKQILSKKEEEKCKKAWDKFQHRLAKYGCKFGLLCPTRGMTIQQTLQVTKPYNFKVLVLDYILLLEGVDSDTQPRVLSSIVRECKIYSGATKSLVIVLAQLDIDDDRIRYSKGMLEHADAAWTWNYSKPEDRENHRILMRQKKARDQELFDFELLENFECMQILNPDKEIKRSSSKNDDLPDFEDSGIS